MISFSAPFKALRFNDIYHITFDNFQYLLFEKILECVSPQNETNVFHAKQKKFNAKVT